VTVDSATSRVSYTGDGATSAYDFTFKAFDDDDLVVTVRDTASPPTETTLTKTTHYTVSGVGDADGGTVTLVASGSAWLESGTANLKTDYLLVIRRRPSLLQEQPFRNLGSFYPSIYEDALDYLLMKVQGLRDELDRTIRAPECDSTGLTTRLIAAASRASKYLGFDSSGQPTVLGAPANTTAVSVFGATLIDDANAAAAATTLGIPGLFTLGQARQFPRVNAGATAIEYVNNGSIVTQTKTTTYTALVTDDFIFASASGGAWSLALPSAATCSGKVMGVRKTDATLSAVTIDPNSTETIGGASTTTLNTEGETLYFVSDGTNWQILHRIIPSKWTSYTPTITGFGTAASAAFFYRREGDSLHVRGKFTAGTPTAVTALIGLPSGLTIDTAKTTASQTAILGFHLRSDSTSTVIPAGSRGPWVVINDNASTGSVGLSANVDSDANMFVLDTGSSLSGAGQVHTFDFSCPITGWNG
jgi:hypothetical protein